MGSFKQLLVMVGGCVVSVVCVLKVLCVVVMVGIVVSVGSSGSGSD